MDINLDNSALSTLSCRRKFQLTVLEGLVSPLEDKPQAIGNATHKVIESVDLGSSLDDAITEHTGNVDPLTLRKITTFFLATNKLPPAIIINDKPAVEVKFKYHYGKYLLPDGKEVNVYLSGTIDRIHVENDRLIITDYKTAADGSEYLQDKKKESYRLSFQLPFYVFALLKSGILPAEYEALLKDRQYSSQFILMFYNNNPPRYVKVPFAAYPDYFIHNEVPYIINTKIAQAIQVAQLKNEPAPHDGMTVYKACEYCDFRPACLHMGEAKGAEYLERFNRRIYDPMTFR